MVLTTDASHTSWGVTFENQSTNGEWSMEERKQLINWLELQTVLLGLQSFLSSSCRGNFGEGKSYSTVNSYRSALSGMLVLLNGRPIGEHPPIVRLLKGMFNVCPPVPRELASVRNTGDEASNVQTVALAGLVSAQRSQALTALTLKDISVSGEWNEILCVKTVKKSRPGKSSTPIMVPKNTSNGRLCQHTALQTCISRTESLKFMTENTSEDDLLREGDISVEDNLEGMATGSKS
ncbi:hypothetical protein P5673_027409 [Acropora cervicornis]|uniref:Uncharacterized protein n=1 Tax=Acropora cervicornis TaxID=6130 RepID=A0AAD9PZN8_ACRCE|nr:hypothetical protein P5673_027409 [Acropora cervicornis]